MFLQIAEVLIDDTDRVLPMIVEAEDAWRTATTGRRTAMAERLYRDRETAGRYLAVNEFPSYDAAMQNSELPETSALAETVGAIVEITAYWNLDLALDMRADELGAMASALVEVFAAGRVDPDRFAEDLLVDLNVPEWRLQVKGRDAVEAWLRTEVGKGNDVESLHWLPAGQILVLEIVTRGRGEHGGLSRQLCVARHERGFISSLVIYCTGVWDAALQARHHTETDLVEPGLVWAQ
jgi:hypothetical protein